MDTSGAPIAGALISDAAGKTLGKTDALGHFAIACAANCGSPLTVVVSAVGFEPRTVAWGGTVVLQPAANRETVSVTAYRTPLGDLESPVSTRVLSEQTLQESGGITLDDQVREIGGVETYRRTSSLVANPSSLGLSLRGLGSTSASRTLVTEDDVPLNQDFAGWVHWEELPELSIRDVEVVRGGASDLYGSSAIGGVINVIPQGTGTKQAELKTDYGSENTYQDSLLFEGHRGPWGGLITGGVLGTDGYIETAPDQRGLIDVNSNVHAQNAVTILDHKQGNLRLMLRASAENEARDNGTPLQKNGTRIWRGATGADWNPDNGGSLVFRVYGSTEHYRQTFSTIGAGRNSETLNRFAKTPDDEAGAVLHYSKPLTPGLLLLVGADTHDLRAGDFESVIKKGVLSYVDLNDRQRLTGAYAELLLTQKGWTVAASARLDWFSNFDGYQWLPTVTAEPHDSEHPFDPRVGISRKLGQHFALSGSGFRGFRAPTPSELYRSTQVGSLLTLPNPELKSERATGWETGLSMEQKWGFVRTSYFWTRVNRPVTALITNPNSNPELLMRENLGQIESRGVSFETQLEPTRWMTVNAGYQYADATVTKGTGDAPAGNWIAEVAHNLGSAQIRAYKPLFGTLSIQGRVSGKQYDDDANQYLLHGYFKLDAYSSHDFGSRFEVFLSGENLLNRAIEVGRTPTLTLGTPRVVRGGLRLRLGRVGD
jgi:outer membrane receptor protein involved in Fe transport